MTPILCSRQNYCLRQQLTSNDVWAVCQTYGVEAARASIVAEIINVFGAYGIAVDPRHLGLVADHMTFDGGYRPLNRAGMADFSSPCLQVRVARPACCLRWPLQQAFAVDLHLFELTFVVDKG